MEVIINQMSSTLRATDSTSLLSPQVLERIVRAAVERLNEQQGHERAVGEERKMRRSVSARETSIGD